MGVFLDGEGEEKVDASREGSCIEEDGMGISGGKSEV